MIPVKYRDDLKTEYFVGCFFTKKIIDWINEKVAEFNKKVMDAKKGKEDKVKDVKDGKDIQEGDPVG